MNKAILKKAWISVVREANSFRFDIDVGNDLFFHARVQSNSEIDFHLIDEYGDSMGAIESGEKFEL